MADKKKFAWRLLGHTLAALAFLATVPGLFITAFAPDYLSLLWLFPPIAIAYAATRVLGPVALEVARGAHRKLRNYDADLAAARAGAGKAMVAAAEQTARASDLEVRVGLLKAEIGQEYDRGLVDGRRRVVMEIVAALANPEFKLEALDIQDGHLVLIATLTRGDPPPLGSRLMLRVHHMRAKAALKVSGYDEVKQAVLLEIDEVVDRTFMDGLTAQVAGGNPDPPASLRVVPREAVVPESFLFDDWADTCQ